MKMPNPAGTGFIAAVLLAGLSVPVSADWDFSGAKIPVDQIQSGGPPRDGIPALLAPEMVPASEAGFLEDDDRVLGLEMDGEARAYPIRILSWHELVNDTVGGRPLLVSW
jgi:hypothetical protein